MLASEFRGAPVRYPRSKLPPVGGCRKRVPDHLERVELGKEERNRRWVPPAHKSGLRESEVPNINDVFKRLGETFTFPVPSNLSDV